MSKLYPQRDGMWRVGPLEDKTRFDEVMRVGLL